MAVLIHTAVWIFGHCLVHNCLTNDSKLPPHFIKVSQVLLHENKVLKYMNHHQKLNTTFIAKYEKGRSLLEMMKFKTEIEHQKNLTKPLNR